MTNEATISTHAMTSTEQIVAPIWAELLQKPAIAPADNFFTLGGDSMMMMIVQFQITEKFGVELPPGTLFESPTLAQFCELIDGVRNEPSSLNGTI